MKLALIPPIPYVWYAQYSDTHLLLSHLMDNTDHGRAYTRSYAGLPDQHYKILDNAAHELQRGEGITATLRKAQLLKRKIHEIVVPDVQQNGTLTAAYAEGAAKRLIADEETRELYEEVGQPRLMYVPQGTTFHEWGTCYRALIGVHAQLLSEGVTDEEPVIGLAKKHSQYFPMKHLLQFTEHRGMEVHMLGWPGIDEFLDARSCDHVRSMDTARPFVYAIAGVRLRATMEGVHRPVEYFQRAWDLDRGILRENIEVLMRTCGHEPIEGVGTNG
jgi:ribosomal protein L17